MKQQEVIDEALGTASEAGLVFLVVAALWFIAVFTVCAGITALLVNWVHKESHQRRIQEHLFLAELAGDDDQEPHDDRRGT